MMMAVVLTSGLSATAAKPAEPALLTAHPAPIDAMAKAIAAERNFIALASIGATWTSGVSLSRAKAGSAGEAKKTRSKAVIASIRYVCFELKTSYGIRDRVFKVFVA